ncbi:MAG: hypothetical protein FIA99_13935 [Ruminiclostridium sp.]|nr:hypothetical protein [Ruminiclostridium sp.]
MAELPEIHKISTQMNKTLQNKVIAALELKQEKCANVTEAEFLKRIAKVKIVEVKHKGKWITLHLANNENILLSLGMGGDVLYFENQDNASEKYQIKLTFIDNSGFTVKFWWFGKFLLASDIELKDEPNTKDVAIDPFDGRFTYRYFKALFTGKKGQIKAFLMDQKNIGGIGNMYMHDILFKSSLHPQKKISGMSENDFHNLYSSIDDILRSSQNKGAYAYESDFFGSGGGFVNSDFLIGYKVNQPCPKCGESIIQIKTGSTSSFICTKCQKI